MALTIKRAFRRLRPGTNQAIISACRPSTNDSRLSDDRSEPDFQILRLPRVVAALGAPSGQLVGFDRRELQAIFNLYGQMVAEGVWRDYAMDFLPTRAIFSIFRRNGEAAYYRIVKEPRSARKQGAYLIVMQTGLILKRGPELQRLLTTLEKRLKLVTF